jgi:hypothetical protein
MFIAPVGHHISKQVCRQCWRSWVAEWYVGYLTDAQINCGCFELFVGNPEPNITWTKDGAPPHRHLGSIRNGRWSLILEDLVVSDSGNYTCIVCNLCGCINFTYKVDIIGMFISFVHPLVLLNTWNVLFIISSLYSYLFFVTMSNDSFTDYGLYDWL